MFGKDELCQGEARMVLKRCRMDSAARKFGCVTCARKCSIPSPTPYNMAHCAERIDHPWRSAGHGAPPLGLVSRCPAEVLPGR